MIRVGIPRALIYYKFSEMWVTFFKEVGAEVIVSPATTKAIKEDSVRFAPNEDCYSTKLYFGHVLALKDKVDYLFIPRYGGHKKKKVGCPKFLGLGEVLQSMFDDLPPIIMPHFNAAKERDGKLSFFRKAMNVGKIFTKNPFKRIRAFRLAVKKHQEKLANLIIDEETLLKWERSELHLNDPPIIENNEQPLKIALCAHSYVLKDPYASLSIQKLLQKQGVDIITSEQMPRELIEKQMKRLVFDLYFDYEREILGTIMHFLESKTIDGIIHLMIFSCGPDSVAGEMAARYSSRDPTIPLLQLVFDELTSETGLKTRIEAFLDMLRRSVKKQPAVLTASVHV